MLTTIRLNGLEKRIQELYSVENIQKPSDITLTVFDDWLKVQTVNRIGATNTVELRDTYHVFLDRTKGLAERRIEMAHELGHMLLHSGNQIWIDGDMRLKQEWQANRFAMYALVPSHMLICSIGDKICDAACVADLAFEYGVTHRFMENRLKLLKEDFALV